MYVGNHLFRAAFDEWNTNVELKFDASQKSNALEGRSVRTICPLAQFERNATIVKFWKNSGISDPVSQ